jgi:hypothetical protein
VFGVNVKNATIGRGRRVAESANWQRKTSRVQS